MRCVASDRFFGSAIAVLEATTNAIAAAIMQSSFFICTSQLEITPDLQASGLGYSWFCANKNHLNGSARR
jgi:hypothetical protein